jgi:hypothetical protein
MYVEDFQIGYIFLANIIASLFTFVCSVTRLCLFKIGNDLIYETNDGLWIANIGCRNRIRH